MLPICWIRVDDRLVHGQVIVAWRQYLQYDGICVVDDEVGRDSFLKDVLRGVTPADVSVEIYTIQEAIAALAVPPADVQPDSATIPPPSKVLLLVKRPRTALDLFEGGLSVPLLRLGLNVGNLASRPGSRRVFKSISLTLEDVSALDVLAGHGVPVSFQPVPEGIKTSWSTIRRDRVS